LDGYDGASALRTGCRAPALQLWDVGAELIMVVAIPMIPAPEAARIGG